MNTLKSFNSHLFRDVNQKHLISMLHFIIIQACPSNRFSIGAWPSIKADKWAIKREFVMIMIHYGLVCFVQSGCADAGRYIQIVLARNARPSRRWSLAFLCGCPLVKHNCCFTLDRFVFCACDYDVNVFAPCPVVPADSLNAYACTKFVRIYC